MQTILSILQTTALQLLAVFGIFFVLGFALSWLQEKTHRIYMRSLGWKGILWTAWFGTPFHEFSHYLFAKIFRHKINSVALFRPNKQTGGLGHVDHSYNPRSLYQQIGNFFIGAAPMIIGPIILMLFFFLLTPADPFQYLDIAQIPQEDSPFAFLSAVIPTLPDFFQIIALTVQDLFSIASFDSWQFWLFLYISFCVASHMAPSRQDRAGMWKGFRFIVALFLIANSIAFFLDANFSESISYVALSTAWLTGIFVYALMISLFHFAVVLVVLGPFSRR